MFADIREALPQNLEDYLLLLRRDGVLLPADIDVGLNQVHPTELVDQLQYRSHQSLRADRFRSQRLQDVAGARQDLLGHRAQLGEQLPGVLGIALAPLLVVLEQRHHGRQIRGEPVMISRARFSRSCRTATSATLMARLWARKAATASTARSSSRTASRRSSRHGVRRNNASTPTGRSRGGESAMAAKPRKPASSQAASSAVSSSAARSSTVKTSLCSSARRRSPLLTAATPSGAAKDSVGTPARRTKRRCSPSV